MPSLLKASIAAMTVPGAGWVPDVTPVLLPQHSKTSGHEKVS